MPLYIPRSQPDHLTILPFVVSALLLVTSASRAAEIQPEMAETFRNYIKDSKHVVLVCEVQKTSKEPERPGGYYEIHVTATVVRSIKGKGMVGDRLSYYVLFEDRIPEGALAVGDLKFLMLDDYGQDEFLVGTGEGWRYTPELDTLLTRILAKNAK